MSFFSLCNRIYPALSAPTLVQRALRELEVHEAGALGTLAGAAFSDLILPGHGPSMFEDARRRVLARKTCALIRHDRILRGEE